MSMRKKTNKIIAFALSVLMLLSSSPAMASSIGSVSGDKTIGEDTAQGASTAYSNVGVGSSKTNVYLTIDDSNVLVGVPTEIIISGTPTDTGEYIGEYSVSAFGDISGDEFVNIVPEENATLKQPGKKDVEASVSQQKTSFSYNDIITNNNSSIGQVTAEGLTAGSWNGDFNFVISVNTQYDDSFLSELNNTILGINCSANGVTAKINTDNSNTQAFTEARLYETYAIPISELGLSVGDKLILTNNGTENYMMSIDTMDSAWNSLNTSSGWTLDGKNTNLVIPENCFAISFVVEKLKEGATSTGANNRITFALEDIPLSDFVMSKADGQEIDYISVCRNMVNYDKTFEAEQIMNLHNADADQTEHLNIELAKNIYGIMDIDLRKTSDNVWVNIHNTTFNGLIIADSTYDELKAVDTNNSLLTFAELLDYAVAHNVILQVEDKIGPMESASNIDELYTIINNKSANNYVYFSSDIYTRIKNNVVKNHTTSNVMIYNVWGNDCTLTRARELLNSCNDVILNTTFRINTPLTNDEIKSLNKEGFKIEVGFNNSGNNMQSFYKYWEQVSPVSENIYSVKIDAGKYEYFVAANRYVNGF